MKKTLVSILCLIAASQVLFARGVDNNSNLSSEYIRTLNRNASFDLADAAAYNPAGTAFMKDGVHVYLSNQVFLKDYKMHVQSKTYEPSLFGKFSEIEGRDYTADNPTLLVPSFYTVIKGGNGAVFFGFNVPGGGGKIDYNDGVARTHESEALNSILNKGTNYKVMGEKIYYAGFTGFSYSFMDMVSVSLGARVIVGKTKSTITMLSSKTEKRELQFDYKERADGIGGIFGVDIKPNKELNIGFRYETETNLKWKVEKKKDAGEEASPDFAISKNKDGSSFNRDLPALFGAGVSYNVLESLRLEYNFTYYFNKQAEWDWPEEKDVSDKYNNGWDTGLAVEYTILKEYNLKASAGVLYGKPGDTQETYDENNPNLNGLSVGAGCYVEPMQSLGLSLGVLKTLYTNDTRTDRGISPITNAERADVDLEKSVFIFSLGAQYSF